MPHQRGGRQITLCGYYQYRLAYRDGFHVLNHSGRRMQQFIVAAYIKMEANDMEYILRNQDRFRAEEYIGLTDYLHDVAAQMFQLEEE